LNSCLRVLLWIIFVHTIIELLYLGRHLVIVESLLTGVYKRTYVCFWCRYTLISMCIWLHCIFTSTSVIILCLHFLVCQLNWLLINWIHISLFISDLHLFVTTYLILFLARMDSTIWIIYLTISCWFFKAICHLLVLMHIVKITTRVELTVFAILMIFLWITLISKDTTSIHYWSAITFFIKGIKCFQPYEFHFIFLFEVPYEFLWRNGRKWKRKIDPFVNSFGKPLLWIQISIS